MSLTLRQVTIERGGRVLARDLTFAVRAGEILGVLGPNGAGKSTLLAVMAGLLPATHGEVAWDGVPLSLLDPVARVRALGYAPQSVEPAWGIPVAAMLDAALEARLITGAEAVRPRDDALQAFDLAALAARPITALSGGETKRLALAVASVGHPEVLLLDEPFAGLDIGHRLHLVETARAEAAAGNAVVLSLHDIEDAFALCQRVLVLDGRGRAELGPPDGVLSPEGISSIWNVGVERDEQGVLRYTRRVQQEGR